MRLKIYVLYFGLIVFLSSCYSFKGISIPPDVKTFSVENFDVQAPNAPANISQIFVEDLKNKIRIESPLNFNAANGDVQFSGVITKYDVSPVAPTPGEVAELNRLEMTMKVTFTSVLHEDDNWSQSFERFSEFASSEDLNTVQDALIRDIHDQLTEDIFNRAFNNW